ncbi:hypothetical protein ElyMa_002580200 [Elysia marginata]|uniref:Uncharacterized protein n=1 Tax=Elysia marginata TaxID=1093978 RepID=A0AAV4H0S6_9GAST|nr:hypothetical protein ElyMa_002580200 [Elysia marginata]
MKTQGWNVHRTLCTHYIKFVGLVWGEAGRSRRIISELPQSAPVQPNYPSPPVPHYPAPLTPHKLSPGQWTQAGELALHALS